MIHRGKPGGFIWIARHELRLAWRDLSFLMTAGRRWRGRGVLIAAGVFAIVMHLVAFATVGRYAAMRGTGDKAALAFITASALLSWSVMLAQSMETVTRGFYARADLDLILTSPVPVARFVGIRMLGMAVSVTLFSMAVAAPFIDALTYLGGWHWLSGFGVVAAMGMLAIGIAGLLTLLLFRMFGPRRTRVAAQILAALIGAIFVIILQLGAILSSGSLSRAAFLASPFILKWAPGVSSPLWLPAQAVLGDGNALLLMLVLGLCVLALAIGILAPRFGEYAVTAAGQAETKAITTGRARGFRTGSAVAILRRKEWTLLRRDPWLVSQSLMQLLYLVPPALLLWRSYGEGAGTLILLVPVLVMASGQLAGGLAWLAVSGEDAPDLIATAPITPSQILQAKIEAVMGAIGLIMAPFLLAFALVSPFVAVMAAVAIVLAAASSTAIQLWFRTQAKRSHFRRRQTSSRIATFAEAFTSIGWAATGALAAKGFWLALFPAFLVVLILLGTRAISPARV